MPFPRPLLSSTLICGALAAGLLTARLLTEPYCTSRPAPTGALEPTMVLRGSALKPFTLGNDAGARALAWARLSVDASYDPLPKPGLSWEYGQLDAVTALDRNFSSAYPFGSAFLSTFRRDKEGAKRILEKWVRYAPNDWRSHAALGFHLYFEMNQPQAAAPYLLRAATLDKAPAWLAALGARMLSESERLPQQLRRLVDLYPQLRPGMPRERLAERIRAVRLHYEQDRLVRALAAYQEKYHRKPSSLSDLTPLMEPPSRAVASMGDVAEDDPEARTQLAQLFAERFVFRYDRNAGTISADADANLQRLRVYETPGDSPPEDN